MKPEYTLPPSNHWPHGALAAAHMARVQSLMDARGIDGTDKRLKALMRRIATAFRNRDFADLTAACNALIDVIEKWPAGEDDARAT